MPENKKSTSHARLYILCGLLLAVLFSYAVVLYSTQIVHGQEYLEQSVRTITMQETVEASRGIITDRNGAQMVSNRQTYNLTFDSGLLNDGDDKNASILRLIQLCRENGLVWADNLPLSKTAPWTYTLSGADDTQKSRFVKLLKEFKLVSSDAETSSVTSEMLDRAGLTADVLMGDLTTEFEIPSDWSETDARDVIGVLYELAARELSNTTAYIMVEDIDSSVVALVNDGSYAGAKVVSASARQYETSCAAHILGTVGRIYAEDKETYVEKGYDLDSLVGKSGVEAAFEDYLRGTDGVRVVSTNSDGKITSELYSKTPQPGNTVELTIDLPLQSAAEDALAATVSKMTAQDQIVRGAGAAVVQVGTGEILALASYPTYDPATYNSDFEALQADPAKPIFNRATQGTYAPGSTFKPCTAIAGLESGVITTTTTINDTGKWYYPGAATGDYFYCWNHGGHGLLNVSQAITNSCNYFFGQVGYLMGLDRLNEYAAAFGLGQHTGIEIGDSKGSLATEEAGQDLAPWAAFGQASYLATPLQLSNYIATLVSGGEHFPAHLLREVKSYDNSKVVYAESGVPENDMQISDVNLNAVKLGMHNLTTTGSLSSYFKNCVVEAGAKTGTAQVNSQKVNNGVFVCFAPYDDPQIAVAIVIEKGGSGSALASTAVEILNAYFTADEIGAAVIGENQLLK
jgi:penicillin-binding protein 2